MFTIKYCIAGVTYGNQVGYKTSRSNISKMFAWKLEDPDIVWYDTYQEAYEHLPAKPNFFIHPKYLLIE